MTSTRTAWPEVMARVPRERFIPDRIWRHEPGRRGNDLVPVDRGSDPETWAAVVAGDEPVDTQVDNGCPSPDGSGSEVTSSCSDRRVVAEMLEALDAHPGDHVLEIGTGTGWNAAILSAAGARVTTIEVDPGIADRARTSLAGAAEIIVGDGRSGWPSGAPYDRVVATVGVRLIPSEWVAQTRMGGRLVVPLRGSWQPPGIAVLERTELGARGRLAGPASFMAMRHEATPRPSKADYPLPSECATTTRIHPHRLAGDRDAATTIGLRVPGVRWAWSGPDEGGQLGTLWMYGDDGRSWAALDLVDEPPYDVEQAGPRRLFDEVREAYRWWKAQGRPATADWLVTVDLDGRQGIELPGQRGQGLGRPDRPNPQPGDRGCAAPDVGTPPARGTTADPAHQPGRAPGRSRPGRQRGAARPDGRVTPDDPL